MPDEYGGIEIEETDSDEFGGVAIAEETPTLFAPDVLNQFDKQSERQELGRALYGAGPFAPGGPESDFTRALAAGALRGASKTGEVIHTAMKPVEYAASFLGEAMQGAMPTGRLMSGVPVEAPPTHIVPGASVIPGLEPPSGAVGVIPSLRRAAAGLTTPGAILIAPVAAGENLASRALQGAFATGAAAGIPGSVQSFLESKSPAEVRGAATDAALSALFAGVLGRQALKPRSTAAIERTPDAVQQVPEAPVPSVPKPEVPTQGAGQVSTEVSSAKAAETRVGPNLEADKVLYGEITSRMTSLIRSGQATSPLMEVLKAELEVVKNRHGGMPPGQTSPARQTVTTGIANEIQPAVRIGGKIISNPDKGHIEMALEVGGADAIRDVSKPENQGFLYKGEFISRDATSQLLGEKTPMTSERLREIRKEGDKVEKAKEETRALEPETPVEAFAPTPQFATAPKGGVSFEEFSKLVKVRETLARGGGDYEVYGVESSAGFWGKTPDEAIRNAYEKIKDDPDAIREAIETSKRAKSDVRQTVGGAPPPTVPPGPTGGAPAAPVPPTPPPPGTTLTDVYQRFEPSPKTRTPIKEIVPKVVESVRTGMASKFRPIDKLAEDIGKSYSATTPKNLSGIFEQLKGSTGRGEADVYRFDRDVSSLVKGSEKDFNAYMFLRRSLDRLNRDLEDIQRAQAGEEVPTLNRRSVAGYTIPELEAKLQLLESNLGPEKVQQFSSASEKYQSYMDKALRLQVESGRMSPEIYQAIKEGNEFYAPFKVMKYFEDIAKPEGTGRKIDTVADYTKAMVGIEDPNFKLGDMLGAARQNILISRILADKNNAMRKLAQLAEFDPEGMFIRRVAPGTETPRDLKAVNVKENGKTVQYEVNKDVAEAIQTLGPQAQNVVAQFMGYAAVPMRLGAVTFNIPFQVSNLLADIPRQALVSKFGINKVADMIRYPMDFADSVISNISGEMFGMKELPVSSFSDVAGKMVQPDWSNVFPTYKNKMMLDFLDSGVAGGTVQEFLTPRALRFQPSALEKTSKDFAKSVLNTIPNFARAIEQISKSVGVQRAMREHGVASGKELAQAFPESITEIRRFSGSPDFGRAGKWDEQLRLSLMLMFFRGRVQGTLADVGRLTGQDGGKAAARTWTKLAAAVGIPTVFLYALNNSPGYREDYDKRPEQEKQNYWLIPKDTFITNEQGEKMRDYWRIPKRETAKWMANFTESAMNFYKQRDPDQFLKWVETAVLDMAPVNLHGDSMQERMESAASSLNPVVKGPFELATGRDLYRHRDIVPESMQKASPEQQYIERTPEVFKVLADVMPDVAPEVFRSPMMIENMVKNFTAGMVTQFLPRKPIEGRSDLENNPLLQRFQAVPYTDSSEFENKMKLLERESADIQLERFRNARSVFDSNKKGSLRSMIDDAREKHGVDPRLFERIVDLYVAEKRGINSQERRILALPVQQRAQFISDEMRGLTPEQKTNLIRAYASKRILTEAVAAELIKLSTP